MRLLRGSVSVRSVLVSVAMTGVLAIAACGSGTSKASSNDLTIWIDSARAPVAQAYG